MGGHWQYLKIAPASISPECFLLGGTEAGLLALLAARGLPIPNNRESGHMFQRFCIRITAAGTAPVLHRIPY